MTLKFTLPALLAASFALAACVQEPPKPITIQDKCAGAVSGQSGVAVEAVVVEETISTAIGPKIYTKAGGMTYSCQGDLNGNIAGVTLET